MLLTSLKIHVSAINAHIKSLQSFFATNRKYRKYRSTSLNLKVFITYSFECPIWKQPGHAFHRPELVPSFVCLFYLPYDCHLINFFFNSKNPIFLPKIEDSFFFFLLLLFDILLLLEIDNKYGEIHVHFFYGEKKFLFSSFVKFY